MHAGGRAALAAASNGEVEGFGYTEVEWTYLKPIGAVMGKPLGFNTGKKLDEA